MAAYLAVPSMGAVLHPLNIRLGESEIAYIANHADDRVIIVDEDLAPRLSGLLPHIPGVEHVIVNGDPAALGQASDISVHRYSEVAHYSSTEFPWPRQDERSAAAMSYTTGSTGVPKGVVYSHRSIYLHSMGIALPDFLDLSVDDRVLVVVPQFHALAWGLPYAAMATGTSLVLPGPHLGAVELARTIAETTPNRAVGVPTVWAGLLQYVDANPDAEISSLEEIVIGGSACPPSLMSAYDEMGIRVVHGWGMTEMTAVGSISRAPAGVTDVAARKFREMQGRPPAGVQLRVVGPDGSELPWDGKSTGEICCRGPWITGEYHNREDRSLFTDGWFRTGDIGCIDPSGYLMLTDRAKDVIKSGGEWISSVALENEIMDHPAVVESAVVGVPDARWGERPLAFVVLSEEAVSFEELRTFLSTRVPRWQLPERWVLVPAIPRTSVGKFDKKSLRALIESAAVSIDTISESR